MIGFESPTIAQRHRELERRFVVAFEQGQPERYELARRLTWSDDEHLPRRYGGGPEVWRRIDALTIRKDVARMHRALGPGARAVSLGGLR